MKIIGVGDNTVDVYLHQGKMYPGGNSVNVPVLCRKAGAEAAALSAFLATTLRESKSIPDAHDLFQDTYTELYAVLKRRGTDYIKNSEAFVIALRGKSSRVITPCTTGLRRSDLFLLRPRTAKRSILPILKNKAYLLRRLTRRFYAAFSNGDTNVVLLSSDLSQEEFLDTVRSVVK